MEFVYPFLGGISGKLYDDLTDSNIIHEGTIAECLKGSQWILLTLMSYNDFNFTAFNFTANFVNYIFNAEAFSKPYETSLLILYPLLLLTNYTSIAYMNLISWLYIVGALISMGVEPMIVKEDVGYVKLISRIVLSVGFSFFIFIAKYIGVSSSIVKFYCYGLGYAITSVCFQIYAIFMRTSQSSQSHTSGPDYILKQQT